MKRALILGVGVIICLVLGSAFGIVNPAFAEPIVLRYASFAPPIHPGTKTAMEVYPAVEKLTNGRVKVQVFHSQSLVPVGQTIDALHRGIADLAFLPLPYMSGQIQWLKVTLLPGVVKDHSGVTGAFKHGLKEMLQEDLHAMGLKIEVAGIPFTPGAGALMTKGKPVTAYTDLKGMKISAPSKGDSEKLKILGASPVAIPGAEAYEALMRGVVDGVMSNIGGFYSHKIQEPADYLTMVPLGAAAIAVLASEKGLAKLSKIDRDIVIFVSEMRSLEEAYDVASLEARRLVTMTPELKGIIYPTKEQLKGWNNAMAPLIDGFLKQTGERGKQALDILGKYNP